jgi:hypothetical protein
MTDSKIRLIRKVSPLPTTHHFAAVRWGLAGALWPQMWL